VRKRLKQSQKRVLTIHLKCGIIKEKKELRKMMISLERPFCPSCGAEIEKTSQFVADETLNDLVVFCFGACPCDCRKSYQWYEHYGYKGYGGMETLIKK
jgi:hypothetical protein